MARRVGSAPAALAVALIIVASAATGLVVRSPARPRPRVLAMAVTAQVAVETPAPVRAAAAPRPRWTGPAASSTDCPQMTNPGGRNVASAPGPDPTDGTVSIPALGVSAPIVRVGFDRSGSMVLPHAAREVAWLDQGPFPGATNNVVLAGHISWGGVPGSFGRIEALRPGDIVQIVLHGTTWRYAVRFSCYFPFNSRRGLQVIGYTPTPSLTLVSCAGSWNASAGTHDLRIVVRAEQVYPPLASTATTTTASPAATPAPAPSSHGVLPIPAR
jgi:sortase (surface protein transpeptidase)